MLNHPATAPITSCIAKATPAAASPSTTPMRPAKGRQTIASAIRASAATP
jgi:hypothetical protein